MKPEDHTNLVLWASASKPTDKDGELLLAGTSTKRASCGGILERSCCADIP